MKRFKKVIFSIIMAIVMLFSCTGCEEAWYDIQAYFWGTVDVFVDTNEELMQQSLNRFLSAFIRGEREEMKKEFSSSTIAQVNDLDEQIDQMFSYVQGEHLAHTIRIGFQSGSRNDGKITDYQEFSGIYTTTTNVYRMSGLHYSRCDENKDNIGIWQFFIIEEGKLLYHNGTYRGDGSNALGIRFDRQPTFFYNEQIVDRIESNDKEGLKALFAPNALAEIENVDEQIDKLIEAFNGYKYYDNIHGSEFTENRNKNGNVCSAKLSFTICTVEEPGYELPSTHTQPPTILSYYEVCMLWRIEDTIDENNVGLWSFYIREIAKPDYSNKREAYWGDGLWTSGFHVDKNLDASTAA